MEKGIKNICFNKKASFDYFLETTFEAGIVLEGSEIKSIRGGNVNLKDSHIQIKNEEAFIINMHISPYANGSVFNPDPTRTRKLLLHKKEIQKLAMKKQLEGITFVPLKIYFVKGKAKMLLGVCKGKKNYDKREVEKKNSMLKEAKNALKQSIR